ncbi:TIGR01244 family sulfur transferase [uncultured Roseobacter sp.]|uniref:TIGR01244 family sulfur transferase n=1 Tax=uncultured Roseobacter sp. TaxID=114847 RepID=UPI0026086A33|nr:TIGR01244 family sulfur transferase [uncultured Roseobacter sp.]
MDIRQITPTFYAAPQLTPEDVPALLEAGIRLILCNRPDEEVPPGYQASDMRAAAESAGIRFEEQPLTHYTMTPDIISRNYALICDCDGPVVAYCASGTRSTIAWALGSAGDMDAGEIVEAARSGGYDLSGLRPTLEAASQR